MNNFPFFNRSTREYLGADIYEESQNLADRKDDYIGFQEDLQPLTYRDRKRSQYLFSNGFKRIFPYLSGITLLFLVVFLSFNINRILEEGITMVDGIIGLISFILCAGIVSLNELVKTRSLSDFFKAKIKKEKPGSGLLYQAVVTALISIVGSGLGLFLIIYQMNDDSIGIRNHADSQKKAYNSIWKNDSLRIVRNYQTAINQKRESIQQYNPGKYRTLRNRLNNEAIALSDKMQAELKQARQDREVKNQQNQLQLITDLEKNHQIAGGNAWIAAFFILLAEILNIICHRFVWVYKARSTREGIEFGAIEPIADQTAYEVQLQRLGAFLQSRNLKLFIPDQSKEPDQATPKKPEQPASSIGYKNFSATERRDPSAPKNPDIVEKVVEKVVFQKQEIHGYEIECGHCGEVTIKQRKNAKFCSRKCRIDNYNEGVKTRRKRLNFDR